MVWDKCPGKTFDYCVIRIAYVCVTLLTKIVTEVILYQKFSVKWIYFHYC